MIVDLDELPDEPLTADVCIIGSGAAGMTIAREFLGARWNALVLEGGGEYFEPASQEPYRSSVIGLPHNGIHQGRARAIGGSTTLWAGQALPLTDIDFEAREWVPLSGWPFGKQELAPYYLRAEQVMQLPHASYDLNSWPRPEPPGQYDPELLRLLYSQFAAQPDFAVKYRAAIAGAPNVTLVTHANVTCLEANSEASGIRHVVCRSFRGKTLIARASYYIVCCGGIDSARLLLASRTVEPQGVGNRCDVVGRYFQDHPGVNVGSVLLRDRRRFRRQLEAFRKGGINHAIKVAATPEFQRRHRILNVAGEIFYPQRLDDPIAAVKTILRAMRARPVRGELTAALRRVLREPLQVADAAFRYYAQKRPASSGVVAPHLGVGCEQLPYANSRILLSEEIDGLGMPKVILDWRVTNMEVRTLEIFLTALASEWRRLEIADLDPGSCTFRGRERGLHGSFADANHHIGTTRMGSDPKVSVTDPQCRVHGYRDLYVASSAVFPTSGFSNPTLTIIALSVRIADEIKSRLNRPS